MTTRTIVLIRHAEAGPAGPGQGDIERTLTRQGRTQADQLGRWMQAREAWRDLAVRVSPAQRTKQTAEQALAGWHRGTRTIDDRLWNAAPDAFLEILETTTGDLALFGHNPGLEWIRRAWTGMLLPVSVGSAHVIAMDASGAARAVDQFQPSSDAT